MLSYFRDHTSSPRLSYSPLFSLTISKNQLKKTAGTSHKKGFQMKTTICRDEMLKNQPNKMGTTPQHIHTIPMSCAILPTMHNKTCAIYRWYYSAVEKKAEECLNVEHSCELFSNIRGRGGASNACFHVLVNEPLP